MEIARDLVPYLRDTVREWNETHEKRIGYRVEVHVNTAQMLRDLEADLDAARMKVKELGERIREMYELNKKT